MIHCAAADRCAVADRCVVADRSVAVVPILEADHCAEEVRISAAADRCAVVDRFAVAVDHFVVAVAVPVFQAARNEDLDVHNADLAARRAVREALKVVQISVQSVVPIGVPSVVPI